MSRRGRRFPPGGGDRSQQRQMMQQLQHLQEEMLQAQEELGEETVEVSVGGGVLKLVMTGHQKVQSVDIDPGVVDPEDVEILEDLFIAAVNEAVDRSQELASERMGRFTSGLGIDIPGLT
ncbi:MAG: YbaB/EbfC family nucleoid-associated protein [Chloroflexota bacterium]|nr:YbaB/EbfC family nucleoid-associated protein [Chloroflexota bacterium]